MTRKDNHIHTDPKRSHDARATTIERRSIRAAKYGKGTR